MSRHPFLSSAWIEVASAMRDEYAHRFIPPAEAVRMNVTVTGAPFSTTDVLGHVDTSDGSVIPADGHLLDPDLSATIPYSTAREMLVGMQYDALLIAFMSGEVEVEGDVTLIMELQALDPTPEQQALVDEVASRLAEITL